MDAGVQIHESKLDYYIKIQIQDPSLDSSGTSNGDPSEFGMAPYYLYTINSLRLSGGTSRAERSKLFHSTYLEFFMILAIIGCACIDLLGICS